MVPDLQTMTDFSTFRVREVRRNGALGLAVAMDDPPPGRAPAGMLVIRLQMKEEGVWRVFQMVFVPIGPLSQPATQSADADAEDK
jgi:hypothetical protein